MSNDTTQIDSFKPTPGMRLWLDTALELMSLNISEIADKCQLSRQSWYQWLKNKDFRDWFRTEWNDRISGHSWKLDIVGFNKANEDFRYWDAMQRRLNNSPEPAQQVFQRVVFVDDEGAS